MLSIFKPNAKGLGHAAFFSLVADKGCVYVLIVKQSGWNNETKKGSFRQSREDSTKTVSIKLGTFELGKIINSIECRVPADMYHISPSGSTKIGFSPRQVQTKDGGTATQFSLSVFKSKDLSFHISFDDGEAVVLRESLKVALTEIIKEDINKEIQRKNSYAQNSQKQTSEASGEDWY